MTDRRPRVLVVTAPAGYEKNVFVARCSAAIGAGTVCDLGDGAAPDEVAGAILDALVAADVSTASRNAVDRLVAGRTEGTTRETLRRLWPFAARDELVVLDDWAGNLATPSGAELFAELVATAHPQRRLAIVARHTLPPALHHALAELDVLAVGEAELALAEADLAAEAAALGVGEEAAAVSALTHGWPLVSRAFLRLRAGGAPDELYEAAAKLDRATLLPFVVHRSVAALTPLARDALAAAAVRRAISHPDLIRVLGEECDDAIWATLQALPFVATSGERIVVHRVARTVLRERFAVAFETAYERTLRSLVGDGRYTEGAHVALDVGDGTRAAAIIDAAPPYTTAPVPLREYVRIIDRLDKTHITRFPNLWVATIPYRCYAVDAATYARESETVYYCLPAGAPADLRAATLMILASAYVNLGRLSEADALIEDALHGFAAEPSTARASLLNFTASLRGIEGRFVLARALAAQAVQISRDRFGENQTLHYIEAHEAAYRGRFDRVTVIIDELLRRRRDEELPLYLAYVAMNGAVFAWVNGDDAAFDRYETIFENTLTPAIEVGMAPLVDAARGRPVRLPEENAWPLIAAGAQLYRIGHAASADDALDAARQAARAADRRGEPYFRLLAYVALFELGDETEREQARAAIGAIASAVESPELQAAVGGLFAGGDLGMLDAYVRRRVRRERVSREPHVAIELLAGRVTRDGADVPFSDKEFELLTLLAATPGPVSRDRIGEALWDHLDPEEWANNLKVTIYRIRTRLGRRDAIVADGGRHRLAPTIEIDLRRAETLVRGRSSTLDDDVRRALQTIVDTHRNGIASRYERYAWSHQLVARIAEVVGTAAATLAADALARGATAEALTHASYASGIDPLDERACEATIRAHLAAGDRDAARRELARYGTSLRRELGSEPPAHLVELVRPV
ncbi:MAG TPA: BTAD domain-containing putative transcriptional regulator [Candidatus Sulfotelmatobacter sp.]|nr:BTAD domain-containing putative transcriptional regulator [Candidatus Sulfotelmatobacter sp.]